MNLKRGNYTLTFMIYSHAAFSENRHNSSFADDHLNIKMQRTCYMSAALIRATHISKTMHFKTSDEQLRVIYLDKMDQVKNAMYNLCLKMTE